MEIAFVPWLVAELEDRGWSQRQLAKRASMSATSVSQVITEQRDPSPDFCIAIAHALRLPPEDVLRRAGHLPPKPTAFLASIPRLHTFLDKLARLDRETQNRIMDTALMLLEIDEAARDDVPAQTDLLP